MPKLRVAGLAALILFVSFMEIRGGAATLAQHAAAVDPTTEGFIKYSAITASGPVTNDAGFDAWQVTGPGGSSFYGQSVNYATAFAQGWRLTARVRIVSGTGWAFVGLNPLTDHVRFDVGVRANGADAVIGLFDTISTTAQSITLAGSASNWLLLDLVYDPATARATLYR